MIKKYFFQALAVVVIGLMIFWIQQSSTENNDVQHSIETLDALATDCVEKYQARGKQGKCF